MKRHRPRQPHPTKAPSTPQLTRRQIWLLASGGGLALVLIVALVVFRSLPHHLTASERTMLQKYESIRVALAQDDLSPAETTAAELSDSFVGNRKISDAARSVANAPSLEAARDAFTILSRDVIPLARGNPGYFILGCPMGSCPAPCVDCQMARFSDWVQSSEIIGNPFVGKAGRSCGAIKN